MRHPGSLPHTAAAAVPGAVARKRHRPRVSYELIACGLHGHVIVGLDAAEIRPADSDLVREYDCLRWHRCLRCDAWIVRDLPAVPVTEYPPDLADLEIPLRGRRLRDRYVLRLVVLDRLLHATVLGALAVGIFVFGAHADRLHNTWTRILAALQNDSGSWIVHDLNRLFALKPSTLYLLGAGVTAYTAVLLVEAVGLWSARRWAEYLTFVEVSVLVPFEVYELAERLTALRTFTLAVNLAICLYLLVAHRLFGLRGGAKAAEAAYGDTS